MGLKKCVKESRVAGGMLLVQVFGTGLQLLSRIILSEGTFIFALMAYRHIVGAVCVAPFAIYFERGNIKKLNWAACFWLFIVAMFGISMAMGFFYFGLRDTTATYATNFLTLIPVTTFLFATVLRIEKLGLNTRTGKIKTAGALLCLAGALTISLYKGKVLHISHQSGHHNEIIKTSVQNFTRGTLFLVASILSYAIWFILQVKLNKVFPYKLWATFLICLIASAQQAVIGLCIDRSKASWRLGWNLQLITIIYSGALATAATFCLIAWAILKKGPTYPSMFNPITLILVAIIEALFLGQDISVGSLLGMSLIIVGLYSFLWAKNKETKSMASVNLGRVGLEEGKENGGNVGPENGGGLFQLTAVVVPTASPCSMGHDENFVRAVALFSRMLIEGLRPEKVFHYFESMINGYSLAPSPDQYACMVDLLGPLFREAKRSVRAYKDNACGTSRGCLGALLRDCKLHCDIELGNEVARYVFEIEPQNAGYNYVSLSNIYASADRWLDVSLVRNQTCERGVKKIPGYSWIYPETFLLFI